MTMMEVNDESCKMRRKKEKRESYINQQINKYVASSRKITKLKRRFNEHLKDVPYTLPRTITDPKFYEKINQVLVAIGQEPVKAPTKSDLLAESLSELTCTDSLKILNDLDSMQISTEEDVNKARLLLKSVGESYRKTGLVFVTENGLEEVAGEIQASKHIIQRVFEECPEKGDMSLEPSRLENLDQVKAAVKMGLWANPNLKILWMQSIDDANRSSKVFSMCEEPVSDLVRLWKVVVELAKDEEDAKILLRKAVKICPEHVEFQLFLARLETYDNAVMVLNKARENNPTEPAYWIMAAKLEEANGNITMVGEVIANAIQSLHGYLEFNREFWMKEAEAAQQAGSSATSRAIICNTHGMKTETPKPIFTLIFLKNSDEPMEST